MTPPIELTPILKFLLHAQMFGATSALIVTNHVAQHFPALKLYERRTWGTTRPWHFYFNNRNTGGRNHGKIAGGFKIKLVLADSGASQAWRIRNAQSKNAGYPLWGWYELVSQVKINILKTTAKALPCELYQTDTGVYFTVPTGFATPIVENLKASAVEDASLVLCPPVEDAQRAEA